MNSRSIKISSLVAAVFSALILAYAGQTQEAIGIAAAAFSSWPGGK